jgi:hypothetical protein
MYEIVRVVLGPVLGALIWGWSTARLRTVPSIVAVILSGAPQLPPAARFPKALFTFSWTSVRRHSVWPPALPLSTTSAGAVRC